MATPDSPQFDWRRIATLGPHPLLARCNPRAPAPLDAGNINTGNSPLNMNYTLFVNAGRTGSPGLEVNVTLRVQPQISVTILLEPGVHAGRERDTDYFNLNFEDAQFLGLPGGGGRMYDHDPPAIHVGVPTPLRKETLRIKLTSYGYVCHDPDGLDAVRARLPPASADGQFLAALTSTRGTPATAFHAWFYCRVPTPILQNFKDSVIVWFRWMCDQRRQPLFQYPTALLNLDMEPLPAFRNSMYWNMVNQQGVMQLGDPVLQIADTIGSRYRRLRAVSNSVATIRESQGHSAFCDAIGKQWQYIKLVRTRSPLLHRATRLFTVNNALPASDLPADAFVYLGYISIRLESRPSSITAPQTGSLFLITWCNLVDGTLQRTGNVAYGMVLNQDPAITAAGANFAVALMIQDPVLKQTAHLDATTAPQFPITLRFIQNRQVPKILLSRMVRFSLFSTTQTVQALQTNVFRMFGPPAFHDDLHQGPRPPLNDPAEMTRLDSIFQRASHIVRSSPLMTNIRQAENNLLLNTPGQIFNKTQLVRTTIGTGSFRGIYGLILILSAIGHRIIFVLDEPADRSRVCGDLFNIFQQAGSGSGAHGHSWRSKKLLTYSTTDVEYVEPRSEDRAAAGSDLSNSGNPLRPMLDLLFKLLLDDLPSHAYLHDQGALTNAPANSPPDHHTPQAMSWADQAQTYFNSHPADRAGHYSDRARVLNGQVTSLAEAREILARLSVTRRKILTEADIVVCDSDTALSFDVRAAFLDPLIFLADTHRMSFAKGASVLLQHPGHIAAFILGNVEDQRHGPVIFASEGRNEAMLTMRRSFWETYIWAGQRPIDLT
jgi:hypothetical protein